ncbi:hypothetical protein ACVWWR_002709 [Bradyrhizobium sp. LM3.2]
MSGGTGIEAVAPEGTGRGPSSVSDARQSRKDSCMTKRVLAIGIEPGNADYSAFPLLTPELVRDYIDAQLLRLRDLGYEVTSCLIDLDAAAEAAVTAALRDESFDCIVIGAGLREPKERLLLFEKVLNLVHRLAPDAAICFNTTPADTAEAVQRWVDA